ncbi:hypothetical protein [endosymbiont GvMRE of Glomus versiforme]|uniref:hypothetical protein n=1 Tax=endosymbiont GvMRE of Glomus versiforme TaxID=2039283 RepID=UPI0011C39ED8|nr:hypothetical protein [endosymbiont GvMRE of Glomus versiforme]
METKNLKEKIQALISENDKHYKEVIKPAWDFLYKKQAEIKELEAIERLQNHPHLLHSYLVYKSISRGNYQPEIAEQINFYGSANGQEKLLEAINSDIERFEKDKVEKNQLSNEQPTNEQLLIMLGERIAIGEIKKQRCDEDDGYVALFIGNEEDNCYYPKDYEIIMSLEDGTIEPNRVKEFLDKHELNQEKEVKHE